MDSSTLSDSLAVGLVFTLYGFCAAGIAVIGVMFLRWLLGVSAALRWLRDLDGRVAALGRRVDALSASGPPAPNNSTSVTPRPSRPSD